MRDTDSCKEEGCVVPSRTDSPYCPKHNPKPSHKYADKDSNKYQRWKDQNPERAKRLEKDE